MAITLSAPDMLCNSPGQLLQTHRSTEQFLKEQAELKRSLDRDYWALRAVADLVPQSTAKLFSGHFFPISQAEQELQQATSLAYIGFYQHAILGLRWVLELGCLSVYWDREDVAETEIKPWLKSVSGTPFKRQILAGLLAIPNVKAFADQSSFLVDFDALYGELSNYAHVRGLRYSSRHLLRGNIVGFNSESYLAWDQLRQQSVKLVVAIHLLKYPVGTQYTPLSEKFGLNPPFGGFIEPHQRQELLALFSKEEWTVIQAIGDADEQARSMADWVESLPDITDEELQEQSESMDREMVENQGYQSWYEMYSQLGGEDPEVRTRWGSWAAELRVWAAERGWLEHGRYGPLPEALRSRLSDRE